MNRFLIKYSMKTPTFNTIEHIKTHLDTYLFILSPLLCSILYYI
jgi:hypothetical protein